MTVTKLSYLHTRYIPFGNVPSSNLEGVQRHLALKERTHRQPLGVRILGGQMRLFSSFSDFTSSQSILEVPISDPCFQNNLPTIKWLLAPSHSSASRRFFFVAGMSELQDVLNIPSSFLLFLQLLMVRRTEAFLLSSSSRWCVFFCIYEVLHSNTKVHMSDKLSCVLRCPTLLSSSWNAVLRCLQTAVKHIFGTLGRYTPHLSLSQFRLFKHCFAILRC
ncbi:hypothetical protein CY34DRAFT_738354 [Suillus luteus UH-Slu-Lm8-n1]|uniref:Unplaced genomic scaffold CY34scaffold_91, whole genome shotgun sequence n=1 Tax=Suillus luteus UH-Slu-Lm8-n1 TaxID=930992 RepID=A0A0D0AZA8_9AGAM|nr:hypothetical protein CY34DRAFT_738354 [Suillus luteus UH-Slu-Lm8-n1]